MANSELSGMYIVFDIGGTNIRVAGSRDGKTFDEPKKIFTPKNFYEGVRIIGDCARAIAAGGPIKAAAGGAPGPFDRARTTLLLAPNLPHWKQKPLKQALEKELDAPVALENDAALAGLGEAIVGAARGKNSVAYMTVSTGIGGARIVRGHIDENAIGFEPGHQYIDQSGNDLESLVSGTALKKRYGKDPREIYDPAVWEKLAKLLAYGLHNTIVHWSPDIVVLGGKMITGDPAILLDRVVFHLKHILTIFPEPPPIIKAGLGDEGGLHGALCLLTS